MFDNAYRGRRIFLTGDTGFKGAWLAWWLRELGAEVYGFALPPEHSEGLFVRAGLASVICHTDGDIRDFAALQTALSAARPAAVFHLAAQALVRRSYADPLTTWSVNVQGTAHVLEAIRNVPSIRAAVVVTSDKCYRDREWVYRYRETDRLGGRDPYSASKACAEGVAESYRSSFFAGEPVRIATARAGNVFGPGDWGEDRLIPDAVRALRGGRPVPVRNPAFVRPWQYVLEPLAGYLRLGAALLGHKGEAFAEAWNFGPNPDSERPVSELVELFIRHWRRGRWTVRKGRAQPHETRALRLAADKARERLGVVPVWGFEQAVAATAAGYKYLDKHAGPPALIDRWMRREIARFAAAAARQKQSWAISMRGVKRHGT